MPSVSKAFTAAMWDATTSGRVVITLLVIEATSSGMIAAVRSGAAASVRVWRRRAERRRDRCRPPRASLQSIGGTPGFLSSLQSPQFPDVEDESSIARSNDSYAPWRGVRVYAFA